MRRYQKSNPRQLNWQKYGELVDSLVSKVRQYSREHNVNFHIIAPILRGGAIPAVAIANKLDVTPMLPIQLKYDKNWRIISLSTVRFFAKATIPSVPNILVVENLTYSGDSVQRARKILQSIYPKAKIYFATTENILINEEKKNQGFQQFFCGLATPRKRIINIYPFQDFVQELRTLNNE